MSAYGDPRPLPLFENLTPPEPTPGPAFHAHGAHLTATDAQQAEAKAARQDEAVAAWFRLHPGERVTPSELHARLVVAKAWPLTSVRRALSNATAAGLLAHHKADRRPGPYGSMESTWSLA